MIGLNQVEYDVLELAIRSDDSVITENGSQVAGTIFDVLEHLF